MLTLNYFANRINIDVNELIDELQENGIHISNPNEELTPSQIESIKQVIEAIKNYEKDLEEYASNYKIFVDTSSFMHPEIGTFCENIYSLLKTSNAQLIVPHFVINELNTYFNSLEKEIKRKAYDGLFTLKKLIDCGLVINIGDPSDSYKNDVFLTCFDKYRLHYNLLLITQDENLSKKILNLKNSSTGQSSYNIKVTKINSDGYLSNLENQNLKSKPITVEPKIAIEKPNPVIIEPKCTTEKSNPVSYQPKTTKNSTDKFRLETKVKQLDNRCIKVTHLPVENDIVRSRLYGDIRLGKEVASGGEGVIYTTNTNFVAKIYKKNKLTVSRFEKIKLMLSKPIECEGICWPKDIIYNSRGEFVGYLMPRARGKEMQKLFLSKPVLVKNMPNWKKRDIVQLSITVLEKIKYLHDRNVILGDINLMNILIASPTEVYFVDTDSYQIEDLPCPVGTIIFTAQELLKADDEYKRLYGKDRQYSDYLRTFENEYFAVAVLLFMIMLPGKNPYSLQGGDSIKENMLNMDFAYPLGEKSNRKVPDGPWKFIWSHMTYDVKYAFYNTFAKDGEYNSPENRLRVVDWIKLMNRYLELLDNGELAQKDTMSEELFPTRRKKVSNINYIRCKICGKEEPEDRLTEGICRDCLNDAEVYKCSQCGKEMKYTNYDKYIKKIKKPDVCHECYKVNNEVYIRIKCSDCGRMFELTNREYKFYIQKGYQIPKRCKSCRNNSSKTNHRHSSKIKAVPSFYVEIMNGIDNILKKKKRSI